MLKRSTIFTAALVASLSLGLTAMAMPAIDTVITQGYDAEEMALIFGISAYDDEAVTPPKGDCDFEDDIEYSLDDPADDSSVTPVIVESNTWNPDCELNSVSVKGPNDQVNHGTFMSSMVHALKELGWNGGGCLVSAFSKLEVGKDDTKVTTADAREAAEADVVVEPADGPWDVMLSTIQASCDKGKDKAPGLAKKGENSHGPAWKTDDLDTHPSELKGKNKDK